MKFTEGAFRDWGYQLAKDEFGAEPINDGPWLTFKNPRTGTDITIGTGSQILRDLGVGKMRLLSYPARFAISGFDLEVVEFEPFE